MAAAVSGTIRHGNAYNIFIFVVTIVSLVIMVLLWMPVSPATKELLGAYDNLICVIFLADFFSNLTRSPSKKEYFIDQRGWLDLLGSVPTIRGIQALGILRLARLSRLTRIYRLFHEQNKKELLDDMVARRSHYAVVITVLAAAIVLMTASIIVLNAESRSDTANITTGGDAIWWAFVTISTVGYGDQYPTTVVGRFIGVCVMVAGVGIIGALASIMASILVGGGSPSSSEAAPDPRVAPTGVEQSLATITGELTALRRQVERLESRIAGAEAPSEETDDGATMSRVTTDTGGVGR
jgi:voltage-gated potassium channel